MEKLSNMDDVNAIGDKDIRYVDFYYFLVRNAKLIIKIIGIGLTVSLIYTLRLKNIWGGEFQIVLESDSPQAFNGSQSLNNRFSQLLQVTQGDELLTEVEILKSPSVLMPIFEIAKKREESLINKKSNMTFKRWQRDLDIGLEEGTNILNIKYQNQNKDVILPTLKNISEVYQDYSSINKNDSISKGMSYLEKRIAEYKTKTEDSYRKAQRFAIKYDLNVVKGPEPNFGAQGNNVPNFNSDVQDIATEAALNKRNLIELLKYFQQENIDNEKIIYVSKLNKLADQSLFEQLNAIELDISKAMAIYTLDSTRIKILIEEKSSLIEKIKDISIQKLLASIDNNNSIINSSKRPDGIFVKFHALNNNYLRDNFTLQELESQYRLLSLEKAKDSDPWKLITNPTVLDTRISPNRSNLMITYSFFVILISISCAYVKEKLTNKIFTKGIIEKTFPYPILEEIPAEGGLLTNYYLKITSELYLKNLENINIFVVGEIESEIFEELISKLKEYSKSNIEINNNIAQFNKKNKYLFIVQSGKASKEDFENLTRRIGLENNNIIGLIFLTNKIYFNETNINFEMS